MMLDRQITSYLVSVDIDLNAMGQGLLGQGPIEIITSENRFDSILKIECIEISAPYGRYGNNFFQLLNAGIIANHLSVKSIIFPSLSLASASSSLAIDDIIFSRNANRPSPTSLRGSFFAPFGFESCFYSIDLYWLSRFIKKIRDRIYLDLYSNVSEKNYRTVAVHFRGGDVFSVDTPVQGWYVQPPASYYIESIHRAIARNECDFIEIVTEDRKNPAIEIVENEIRSLGIPFRSGEFKLAQDVKRILSSETIIASYGTFCEATALMSSSLKNYYGFRNESTQPFVRPFIQSKIGAILRENGVRTFIFEDVESSFLRPGTWENAEWQRDTIVNFPRDRLRFFESC